MTALQAYEAALAISERMLVCARSAQWDQLVAMEKERAAAMETMRRRDPDPTRDASSRERKRAVLERMIACDEEIAVLTQDWMGELRQILTSVETQNKLARTYRSG
ncbi:MAG: flagellar protein FliT [Proteobacteria bacterium]|nr:flagellar protein FliT [Burkholderiales bacterium]